MVMARSKQPTWMYGNALLVLSSMKLFVCDLVSTDYRLCSNQIVGPTYYITRHTVGGGTMASQLHNLHI